MRIRDGPAAVTGDADLLSLCRQCNRTAWEDDDSWANDPEESEDDDNLKYWNPMEKGSDGRYPIGALFVFNKELLWK